MTSEDPHRVVVLIIDDDRRYSNNAIKFFSRAPSATALDFRVTSPDDIGDTAECFRLILAMHVEALLIDQRLGERSGAPYTGLELASWLRELSPSLPIFILTKYSRDDNLEEKGFAVDDVMDKALLRHHADSYVGRILRATSRYHEAQSQSSRRMHQLLAASLERELTASESNELRTLRAEAGISILGREIELAEFEQSRLQGKENILAALERLLREEGERRA